MEIISEAVGYFASFIIIIAMTVHDRMMFRLLSTIGSVYFVIYGILISSWPVIITNIIIIVINLIAMSRGIREN